MNGQPTDGSVIIDEADLRPRWALGSGGAGKVSFLGMGNVTITKSFKLHCQAEACSINIDYGTQFTIAAGATADFRSLGGTERNPMITLSRASRFINAGNMTIFSRPSTARDINGRKGAAFIVRASSCSDCYFITEPNSITKFTGNGTMDINYEYSV